MEQQKQDSDTRFQEELKKQELEVKNLTEKLQHQPVRKVSMSKPEGGAEDTEMKKVYETNKLMQLEIERLKKVQPQLEQISLQQQNNATFRKLMKALQQAKVVIEHLPEQ